MTDRDSPAGILCALSARSALWTALAGRGVVLTAGRGRELALHRPGDLPELAERMADAQAAPGDLERLAQALERPQGTGERLLDMARAADLVRRGLAPEEALSRALVRYQGTDGLRGKVAALPAGRSPLAAFQEEAAFTPELVELLCSTVARRESEAGQRPTAVLAEDGRDAFAGRRYVRAAARGLARAGFRVLDLGVAPTPLVPAAQAMLGAELGVALTASHNPADQNGLKIFLDGRKPLPEPDEHAHSARAFISALDDPPAAGAPETMEGVEAGALLRRAFDAGLGEADREALRPAFFVVDAAHGAYAPYAAELLSGLGLAGTVLNADMTGENINRGCGVAEIEGCQRLDPGPGIAGELRRRSLSQSGPVFGISLDGDGDRALLLVHDRAADEVRVIDGDRLAYLLARVLVREPDAGGRLFAGTVESDLAVFAAARALGLETAMTPVGDKWLSARSEVAGRLLVGAEASGHLVRPVTLAAPDGASRTVLTGNGLLTGLWGAAAILGLGLDPREAAEPYAPGLTTTLYTYFVDRDSFRRGSQAWDADLAIAESEVARASAEGRLPAGARLRESVFPDDRDMLYLAVEAPGAPAGALFVRNSGTENKIAVYARGDRSLEAGLLGVARALGASHARMLRDVRLPEARAGERLTAELVRRGRLEMADARRMAIDCGLAGEAQLHALIHALSREGRVRRLGEELIDPGNAGR